MLLSEERVLVEFIFLSQLENVSQKVVKHLHAKSCHLQKSAVKCSHVFHTYFSVSYIFLSACASCRSPMLHPCVICNALDVLFVCTCVWVCAPASMLHRRRTLFSYCTVVWVWSSFVKLDNIVFRPPFAEGQERAKIWKKIFKCVCIYFVCKIVISRSPKNIIFYCLSILTYSNKLSKQFHCDHQIMTWLPSPSFCIYQCSLVNII